MNYFKIPKFTFHLHMLVFLLELQDTRAKDEKISSLFQIRGSLTSSYAIIENLTQFYF